MNLFLKWSFLIVGLILIVLIVFFSFWFSDRVTTTNCNIKDASLQYIFNTQIADIVITFTTMPNRMNSDTFRKVVCSMMQQTKRPKEIRLNIPYVSKRTGKEYIIPNWLTQIPITIIRCEDFGPATKYIPTIKQFLNTEQKIIIYDDDSIMPVNLVETFDLLSQEFPEYCLTCASYRFVGSKTNEKLKREDYCDNLTWSRKLFSGAQNCIKTNVNTPTFTDIATGWSGYLLTPKMLDFQNLIDFDSMPKDAFYVDDVVISACLLSYGTKIIVHPKLMESKPTYKDMFTIIWNSASNNDVESLGLTANKEMSHDQVMEHFFKSNWQFLDN